MTMMIIIKAVKPFWLMRTLFFLYLFLFPRRNVNNRTSFQSIDQFISQFFGHQSVTTTEKKSKQSVLKSIMIQESRKKIWAITFIFVFLKRVEWMSAKMRIFFYFFCTIRSSSSFVASAHTSCPKINGDNPSNLTSIFGGVDWAIKWNRMNEWMSGWMDGWMNFSNVIK